MVVPGPLSFESIPTLRLQFRQRSITHILCTIRVTVRAGNGRVREANFLIDSGAAITIIRKNFAKAFGLQVEREPLEISLVRRGRLKLSFSRRVKFLISALSGG